MPNIYGMAFFYTFKEMSKILLALKIRELEEKNETLQTLLDNATKSILKDTKTIQSLETEIEELKSHVYEDNLNKAMAENLRLNEVIEELTKELNTLKPV